MKNKPNWRAIIAFTDSDDVSDDWNWFFGDIRDACEGKGISVIHAGPKDRQVTVASKEKPLANVNISEYFKYHKGYLFMECGREVEYQKYDQSFIVLKNASEYFAIPLIS